MKRILAFFVLIFLIFATLSSGPSEAAKKSKKGKGLSAVQIEEISTTVDTLTTKIYAGSLFSPEDNEKLINVKIKLDNQILVGVDPQLAPLYYKAGNLYKAREYKTEAVDCYQTILENFSDTALAPKALKELNALGVVVNMPQPNTMVP